MKKNENKFFNLFDAEEDTELADNTENDVAGGQFSFFDNEETEEPAAEPAEEKPKRKRGFFAKKERHPNFFFDEEHGYEVSPANEDDSSIQDTDVAEVIPVDSVPLTEDAEFTVEHTAPADSETENEEIASENAVTAENEFAVEDTVSADSETENEEIASENAVPSENEFAVEDTVSTDSETENEEIASENAVPAENEFAVEDTVPADSENIQPRKEKGHIPVFRNDDATEKMVSILEDDVSSEIVDDEPLNIPPQSRKEKECRDLSGLKNFRDIKKMSVMEKFETPYVYSSKNEERVRYRLSLPSDKNPRKTRRTRDIISMVITLVAAFLIAMFLRSFVFVFATVDGPSMLPTLETGEKIFVTRYTYYFQEIERGDIVVCDFPSDYYPDHYVKRVIGLGGEKVSIKNGVVYINGEALSEDYILSPPIDDMEETVVPEGCVFVMGDNRNNSTDSRKSYIGPINKKLIIGKARCILFPFSKFGTLEKEQ